MSFKFHCGRSYLPGCFQQQKQQQKQQQQQLQQIDWRQQSQSHKHHRRHATTAASRDVPVPESLKTTLEPSVKSTRTPCFLDTLPSIGSVYSKSSIAVW